MHARPIYRLNAFAFAAFVFAEIFNVHPAASQNKDGATQNMVFNPYENVDWNSIEHLHSFSHQHGGRTPDYAVDPEIFWEMGFRHFPFSNYYPSKPQSLTEEFRKKHPDALWAPNAEHHSAHGASHFNTLDSYYTTGHGESAKTSYSRNRSSPVEYEFSNLNMYDEKQPWLSIYRLDLFIDGKADAVLAMTVEGAQQADPATYKPNKDSEIKNRRIPAKSAIIYIRAESDKVKVKFDFNPNEITTLRFVIRQGVHRPWQDAYRAALDGTLQDSNGNPVEGLRFPDGGGITLNHTGGPLNATLEKLNFDPRVLGIEVWNQHLGFGRKGTLAFYNHWDEVLSTGKRCFGFFVRDHFVYERGRNILLVPESNRLSLEEKEHNASRAYRNGTFYGLLGALAIDGKEQKTSPYDYSAFKFTRITLKKDKDGNPEAVEVSVGGADTAKRPGIQVRFITDKGLAFVENKPQASFALSKDVDGKILEKYVRIEAFAYPPTHLMGKPLTAEDLTSMNVLEISRLHDTLGGGYGGTVDFDKGKQAPIPIVDMLFSQAIMFNY